MRRTAKKDKRDEKVIEIDTKKLICAFLLLVMCGLIIFGLIRFIKSFMKISVFEITGDYPYESEEIINASGLKKGDKLYDIDEEKIINTIKLKCPYVKNVKVESKFPNRIKFNIESFFAAYYVEIFGDYYAIDANMRVLEETSDNTKFINLKVPKLCIPNIKTAIVGSELIYGADESEIKFTEEFLSVLRMSTFTSRLTLVDIDNRFEIYVQVDGKIDVYMGNSEKAKEKLKAVETALADPRLERCISAKIDVSNPNSFSVAPVIDYSGE